jgi:hypothetical protein
MDRDGEGGMREDEAGLPPVTAEQVRDTADAVDRLIKKKFEVGIKDVEYRDGVILHHDIQFTTLDAIRLLFGARFFMHVVIHTEHVVGKTNVSETQFYVGRLRWGTRSVDERGESPIMGPSDKDGGRDGHSPTPGR